MGEAALKLAKEHLLCVLPFPEDKRITEHLKRTHNVDITYHQVTLVKGDFGAPIPIPDELWAHATILISLTSFPPTATLARSLKFVQLLSAGINQLFGTPLYTSTAVPITNSSGIHAPQIAEWVILQILSNAHKEKLYFDWQKKHYWGSHTEVGLVRDSIGQRVGILGYGAIGRQVGRVAKSLGMDVIAYTASPRTTPESRKDKGKYIVPGTGDPDGLLPSAWYSGLSKPSLHKFLSQDIDILLVAVPLTAETEHFLGAEEFTILGKQNAFIVNIARGAILQQDDLIAALKKPQEEGGLRGAALDVTDPEPLPKESELWDLENVVVTPHVSGLGTEYMDRCFQILDQNLTNLEKGEEFINVVDREKGY